MHKTSKYYNNIFSNVSNRNNPTDNFYQEIDLLILSEIMPKFKENLLDLGCGLAPYSTKLAYDYDKIYLIDVSNRFLKKAKINVQKNNEQKQIFAINSNFKNLSKFNIPEIDLLLATGASLCYQNNSIIKGLELSFNILREGGYIFGDVWNKYGILMSDSYSEEIPALTLNSSSRNIEFIKDFLQNGVATEIVENNSINTFMTDSYSLKKNLINLGFKNIKLYGRKTLSLIWSKEILNNMIIENYTYSFELEKLLSRLEFYMAVSPKISFVAKK